jgi:hypothetical protein
VRTHVDQLHYRSARAGRPTGAALVWAAVALTLFCAIALVGADLGRVHLVKTELQRAADAAARAAAAQLPETSAARLEAQSLAGLHQADGQPVMVVAGDVAFGRWDGAAQLLDTSSPTPDAVSVTCRRAASRGNAVPLLFGAVVGVREVDLSASATALLTAPAAGYGIIGLDWVQMGGSSRIDSYRSDLGSYGGANVFANGSVGSNGQITNGGASRINGSADSLLGSSGNARANANRRDQLAKPLNYPVKKGSKAAGADGDFTGGLLVDGTYYFNDFRPASTLTLTGPVTVYADGAVQVRNVYAYQNRPGNFKLNVTSSADVSVGANGAVYIDLYAPMSNVRVTGTGDLYGQVLGKTVRTWGNGKIHYDESLPTGGTRSISIVK